MEQPKIISARVPAVIIRDMKKLSEKTGRKMQSLVADALARYIEEAKRADAA